MWSVELRYWSLYTRFFVDCVWNVMALAQKPDFVFRRNGRVNLNRRGCQFSPLLAAKLCASAVVMLATPCSEVVWRVLATYSICQSPFHFPFRASPCAITFQLESTKYGAVKYKIQHQNVSTYTYFVTIFFYVQCHHMSLWTSWSSLLVMAGV